MSGNSPPKAPDLISDPRWDEKDPESIARSYYAYVVQLVASLITWYDEKAGRFGVRSRRIRIVAIVFGTAGSVLVAISSSGLGDMTELPLGPVGLTLLAVAAAWVGADRFFGLSTGWMRFRQTELRFRRALDEFKLEWAVLATTRAPDGKSTASARAKLERIRKMLNRVYDERESETNEWMQEFQRNLSNLDRYLRREEEREELEPCDVRVVVDDGEDYETLEACLDRAQRQPIVNSECVFARAAPGMHEVYAEGAKDGRRWRSPKLSVYAAGRPVQTVINMADATEVSGSSG